MIGRLHLWWSVSSLTTVCTLTLSAQSQPLTQCCLHTQTAQQPVWGWLVHPGQASWRGRFHCQCGCQRDLGSRHTSRCTSWYLTTWEWTLNRGRDWERSKTDHWADGVPWISMTSRSMGSKTWTLDSVEDALLREYSRWNSVSVGPHFHSDVSCKGTEVGSALICEWTKGVQDNRA